MKKILIVVPVIFILIFVSMAANGETPKIIGIYKKVPLKTFKYDGKKVEVLEFLSFNCHQCYEFEKFIPVIKGNYPKKVQWKVIPIYWGEDSPKAGEAYLLAVDKGKGPQMKKALFEANFKHKQDIKNIEVLEGIAKKIGLGSDFSNKLRSGAKAKEAHEALGLASEYGLEETPSMIIAGNLKVDGHSLNHRMDMLKDNILLIIKGILESKGK
ncbi:MAG: DsbA family protein [Thermodesulfovibrionales bacterium]